MASQRNETPEQDVRNALAILFAISPRIFPTDVEHAGQLAVGFFMDERAFLAVVDRLTAAIAKLSNPGGASEV